MAPLAPSGNPLKNCAIIGLGYIGSPTAVVVPNTGFKVIGVDINRHTGALAGAVAKSQCPLSRSLYRGANVGTRHEIAPPMVAHIASSRHLSHLLAHPGHEQMRFEQIRNPAASRSHWSLQC